MAEAIVEGLLILLKALPARNTQGHSLLEWRYFPLCHLKRLSCSFSLFLASITVKSSMANLRYFGLANTDVNLPLSIAIMFFHFR